MVTCLCFTFLTYSDLDLYINCPVSSNKMVLKSSPLPTPCILSMCDHDIHLMQAFRAQLQQVGITFEELRPSSCDALSSVRIKTVPSVFLARAYLEDGEVLRTEIKTCIEVELVDTVWGC